MFWRKGEKKAEDRLVTVLATGNLATIAVAKTILDSAGIKYLAKSEMLQGLDGFDPAIGQIEIQVLQSNVKEASKLLKDLY